MKNNRPGVGTGIAILNKQGQVLFGKRTYNPIGYSMPGGHLEYGETLIECAKREALEEAGVEIENVEVSTIGENIYLDKNWHTITIFILCTIKDGETPKNMEPEKCDGWDWFNLDNLPTNFAFNYDSLFANNHKILKDYVQKHIK